MVQYTRLEVGCYNVGPKVRAISLSDLMETIVLCYIYPGATISIRCCSLPPGNDLHAPNVCISVTTPRKSYILHDIYAMEI